jgi:hypothetical protein
VPFSLSGMVVGIAVLNSVVLLRSLCLGRDLGDPRVRFFEENANDTCKAGAGFLPK